jgi:glycosyltransferase involved in cell wall biosynthesis
MIARPQRGRPGADHANHGRRGAFIRREIARSIRVIASLARLAPSDVVRRRAPHQDADLVTMIIPMRNARAWIELCLKSVLAQTHANLEVFCVDDCSTDDSYARVVQQFGADRRLCMVRLQRRVGPYQIKNWVISRMARGRFVAMQDADDVSHPARIARQVRWMRRSGSAVSGTYIHQFSLDGTGMIRGTTPVARGDGELHNLVLYPPVAAIRAGEDFGVRFGERRFALAKHGSQMYTRDALRAFGGFDGRTSIVADTDLNWRMLRFVDIGNLPEVLYSRRIHRESLTRRPDTAYGSSARQAQRAAYDLLQREVARRLGAGDTHGARALCTQDLFHGDVAVAEISSGFDVS